MSEIERYAEIKLVHNTCPRCRAMDIFRLRFKYENEGSMLCTRCGEADKEQKRADDENEDRLMQLLNDIEKLKERGLL